LPVSRKDGGEREGVVQKGRNGEGGGNGFEQGNMSTLGSQEQKKGPRVATNPIRSIKKEGGKSEVEKIPISPPEGEATASAKKPLGKSKKPWATKA